MARQNNWTLLDDESLLKVRLCDLNLRITPGSLVARCRQKLYKELAARRIVLRPHIWISDDWFSPDGVAGFAVPFFLQHERLMNLTREHLVEVEGGTEEWCMRIMRHETAHALDNAYGLRKLKQRQSIFGLSSTPYPKSYSPKPYSRKYVVNLDSWYGQAHPEEDWAETFAVWLNPASKWRLRYRRGLAHEKIEYVHSVMGELVGKRAANVCRDTPDCIEGMEKTLGQYYRGIKRTYVMDGPHFFDRELLRVFSKSDDHKYNGRADKFLRRERAEVRTRVCKWTGHYHYAVNDIINELIERSRVLNLHLRVSPRKTLMDLVAMLSARTAIYLSSGEYKIYL